MLLVAKFCSSIHARWVAVWSQSRQVVRHDELEALECGTNLLVAETQTRQIQKNITKWKISPELNVTQNCRIIKINYRLNDKRKLHLA